MAQAQTTDPAEAMVLMDQAATELVVTEAEALTVPPTYNQFWRIFVKNSIATFKHKFDNTMHTQPQELISRNLNKI